MEAYRKDLEMLCSLLNKNKVEYMIIGGLAVNYHGFQRATGDIDIWYNATNANFQSVINTIQEFGFDTSVIESKKYKASQSVISLPLDRFSIQFISNIHGKFTFTEAYKEAENFRVIETTAKVMSYNYLIANKIMARRPKDLEDIRQLELRNGDKPKVTNLSFFKRLLGKLGM